MDDSAYELIYLRGVATSREAGGGTHRPDSRRLFASVSSVVIHGSPPHTLTTPPGRMYPGSSTEGVTGSRPKKEFQKNFEKLITSQKNVSEKRHRKPSPKNVAKQNDTRKTIPARSTQKTNTDKYVQKKSVITPLQTENNSPPCQRRRTRKAPTIRPPHEEYCPHAAYVLVWQLGGPTHLQTFPTTPGTVP